MVNCIICHLEIVEGTDLYHNCPNGHPAHDDCLREWLVHSSNCPLCSEPYSEEFMRHFQNYLTQKEIEKQGEMDAIIQREKAETMQRITREMLFMKFLESIEKLLDANEFEYALSRLESYNDGKITEEKKRTLLFMRGKINYLRGRYDLAINSLFKLVKEQYDYPDAFLYLGKSYQELGLEDKAKWAFDRVQ